MRTHLNVLRPAAGVAVLLVVLAGCGGKDASTKPAADDSPSSTSTPPSTPSTAIPGGFLSQANTTCKAGNAAIRAVGQALPTKATRAQFTAALVHAADLADKEVTDILALQVPANVSGDITAYAAAVHAATAEVRSKGVAVANGPDPFTDADARAKALGLNSCVSSAGT